MSIQARAIVRFAEPEDLEWCMILGLNEDGIGEFFFRKRLT
jgi:hypothetical protein